MEKQSQGREHGIFALKKEFFSETSTYSSSGFCTVNCRPTASNYQLFLLRLCQEPNPGLRGGRRECYHSAKVAPETEVQVERTTDEVCNEDERCEEEAS